MPTIEAHTLRAIAVEAECDPRTVTAAVSGRKVRPMVLARIRKVLEKRGMDQLLAAHGPIIGPSTALITKS